jgi:hypothetical protein
MWAQLFLRMSGDQHWYEPPWHKPIPSFSKLSLEEINEIMNDPTWTKGVLFRDPTRRLLSSYLYLIDNPSQVKSYRNNLLKYSNGTTWDDFLSAVIDKKFQNIHWRPQVTTQNPTHRYLTLLQADYCGLHKYRESFNFVANLETISTTGPQLLKDLGIWSEYGEREWSLTKVINTPRGNIAAIAGRNASARHPRYHFQYPKVIATPVACIAVCLSFASLTVCLLHWS